MKQQDKVEFLKDSHFVEKIKTYEVWTEGFICACPIGKVPLECEKRFAYLVNTCEAKSFRDACIETYGVDDYQFDVKQLTYRDCKLYPSKKQAQRSFE